MTTTTKHKNIKHRNTIQTLWIRTDYKQANSSIYVAFDDPANDPRAWQLTPFQIADARHNTKRAIHMVLDWAK